MDIKFAVSTITQYEIYIGAPEDQIKIWDDFFESLLILPFDSKIALIAADINSDLKKLSKQINIADLFIASTAIAHNLQCATLNKKHFERIEKLQLID